MTISALEMALLNFWHTRIGKVFVIGGVTI